MPGSNKLWLAVALGCTFVFGAVWIASRIDRHRSVFQAAEDAGTGSAESEVAVPRSPARHSDGFQDLALESGIDFRMNYLPNEQGEKFKANLYDHGCGVVVADFNGDGPDDIYLLNQLGPNGLYINRGDGTFMNRTQEAGVALEERICVGATAGDYDNDGDQDLFVTSTRGGNVLFQNLGNARFKDVTRETGLSLIAHSQTAAFCDLDNDGYLDLFVTNCAGWTTDSFDPVAKYFVGGGDLLQLASSPKEFNVFYRNNRDGTFTDLTECAGLRGKGWGGDTAIADFDEDGNLDLFVTNMFGMSQLYRNEGNGIFTDVAKQALGRTSFGAIGSRFFDFDNDGHFDLYVVDMHFGHVDAPNYKPGSIDEFVKYRFVTGPRQRVDQRAMEIEKLYVDGFQIDYDDAIFGNTLFRNLGNGKFDEVSDVANTETFWPWGIATGDFDNDGYEDVYLPSGMGYPFFYWRSYLLMNYGNGTFQDRCRNLGMEPPARGAFLEERIGGELAARSSRCAATGDFDGDGRLEIVVNNFNDSPYYYKNNFPRWNYVAFRLKGTKSNWDAIGAVVKIHIGDEVMVRQVQAAGGYLSQSAKTIHFGLGDRSTIDRVEVRWPSGVRQEISNPEINMLHLLTEPGAR